MPRWSASPAIRGFSPIYATRRLTRSTSFWAMPGIAWAMLRDHAYQLIVLDAFSSDAVPVHLLSREAIRLYRSKLAQGGLLVFNLSNRYLDLDPLLGRQAADAGLVCRIAYDLDVSEDEKRAGKQPSIWAVMAGSESDLGGLATDARLAAPYPACAFVDLDRRLLGSRELLDTSLQAAFGVGIARTDRDGFAELCHDSSSLGSDASARMIGLTGSSSHQVDDDSNQNSFAAQCPADSPQSVESSADSIYALSLLNIPFRRTDGKRWLTRSLVIEREPRGPCQ